MIRRKPGAILPLELDILSGGLALQSRGEQHFYGFALAKEIATQVRSRSLTAYGTLYRALDRLAGMGLVEAEWEDPQVAADEGRPRRRLYRITPNGEAAVREAVRAQDTVATLSFAQEGR